MNNYLDNILEKIFVEYALPCDLLIFVQSVSNLVLKNWLLVPQAKNIVQLFTFCTEDLQQSLCYGEDLSRPTL